MTLQQVIYQRIIENNRVACYKIYDEIWYVITWNKQTYIHYTRKEMDGKLKIYWYLSASTLCPKWKAQTNEITI